MPTIITPYDNKIGLWHHKGQNVTEKTVDELAQTIRRHCPAASQVFVKTSDGVDWQGRYDRKASMAITGKDAILRWVETLQKYGLEFHAWCVPQGLNIEGEARVIIDTCTTPGVRSMVLDVEPYRGFYQGGRATVRPLMTRIRAALPGAFHLAMTVDPRPQHYTSVFPEEWFPFVNSVHLQLYWKIFGATPEATLQAGFKTWGKFGRPLFALLEADNVPPAEAERARALAVNTYRSPGVSWWVLGILSASELAATNRAAAGYTPETPPGTDGAAVRYGASILVQPGRAGYTDGKFPDAEPGTGTFQSYVGYLGGTGKTHPTNDHVANVWARYDPQIRRSGWYTIEAFIPNLGATSGKMRYKLHGVRGEPSEIILTVPQALYNNEWATLGTFYIEAGGQQPGVIYLNDWTFEPGLAFALDAIRWRPVITETRLEVVSNVGFTTRELFRKGQTLGSRADVFSIAGDSISASPLFIPALGRGADLGAYRAELEPTLQRYLAGNARGGQNSFLNPPIAAGNGWGADRILQAGFANPTLCGNDSPLVCELKNVRPAVMVIMIGTNDSGGVAPEEYTQNLRRIVEITMERGTIPILSTIPPKLLGAWHTERVTLWNNIIRGMAYQYEIPLWDYWFALQSLPNQGISGDGVHPSAPPDGATGRFTAQNLAYGYTVRNLGLLHMLRAVNAVMN
ncbi:MAG: hypothetical protein HS103_06990 [Anaerolineales bacterium]|nr:hypothetical protein [Anaerolineales bacterium]